MRVTSALILALCVCLSGCIAGRIRGDITTFHELQGPVQGARYTIVPSKGQEDSLEFRSYVPYLCAELNKKGMVESEVGEAKYHVYLTYDLGNGQTVSSSTPIFGQTSGGTTVVSGTVYGARGPVSYSGTLYQPPSFGVIGAMSSPSTYYQQRVNVAFVDVHRSQSAGKPITVCDMRMVGADRIASVARVMPLMLERMFYGFPQQNGSSQTFMIPIPFN
jgi:hypothetical protein